MDKPSDLVARVLKGGGRERQKEGEVITVTANKLTQLDPDPARGGGV